MYHHWHFTIPYMTCALCGFYRSSPSAFDLLCSCTMVHAGAQVRKVLQISLVHFLVADSADVKVSGAYVLLLLLSPSHVRFIRPRVNPLHGMSVFAYTRPTSLLCRGTSRASTLDSQNVCSVLHARCTFSLATRSRLFTIAISPFPRCRSTALHCGMYV